ncbi:hypothetical protein C900_01335 [Fulvivirga imtechensis AK7]|uniref:Uncharacterized protein n=2 Tax=Fulvivirga TaxID=396811 RepID=L8JY78_9BACT|nr:hypothetical protein C900_01335 [Fulvivirga imtechensis AK7]
MIIDQIDLLKSEERKLRKFKNYNEEASETVNIHLEEIRRKKDKLYKLCDLMGIDRPEETEPASNDSLYSRRVPQPTGRFGSALIHWQR